MQEITTFDDVTQAEPVRGYLHCPGTGNGDGLVLTHGAGAHCETPLLISVASAFCDAGFTVLRCDLPFRQARASGPPPRGSAVHDQEGLRAALVALRRLVSGRVFLGGHSYGGRQASLLAAEAPRLVAALLLLSYPLHPPRKPEDLRTTQFPHLHTAALFVHGERDPFGSIAELTAALALIPARTELMPVRGAGHELLGKRKEDDLPERIVAALRLFAAGLAG
jgi:predicted alpha/beta-hydrolase family hydrolase